MTGEEAPDARYLSITKAPKGAATKHTEQSAHQAAIWVALEYAGAPPAPSGHTYARATKHTSVECGGSLPPPHSQPRALRHTLLIRQGGPTRSSADVSVPRLAGFSLIT